MKATGIVRRIDDLGRIVIPKEIRRTLRIRETDPLEIYTNQDGEIILKKYSSMGDLEMFAGMYADSMAQATGNTVLVADRDRIVAVTGSEKKDMLSKDISSALEEIIGERRSLVAMSNEKSYIRITADGSDKYAAEAICPIISEGDVCGAVIMTSKENKNRFGDTEMKMVTVAADFLGKQMEA